MLRNLGLTNSTLNQFIGEIRDVTIQKDRLRFRRNLERIGEIFAYEISKTLQYKETEVTTPLGIAMIPLLQDEIVLATVLRAGLPLHNGLLNVFDKAGNAFIAAYRKYHQDGTFDIRVEYVSSPEIDGKVLILSDPMLATGSSVVLSYRELLENGTPTHTHIVTCIASNEGIEYLMKYIPNQHVTIWTAAIDNELTVKSYIVPGLGDAGDLAFGEKE